MVRFSVKGRAQQGVRLIEVSGDLDITESNALQALVGAWEQPVVVDLSDVGFMGATGLYALLVCQSLTRSHLHRFVLVVPATGPARQLMDLVGGSRIFSIAETQEEAIERARGDDRGRDVAAR